jgi:iron(III) transport system permease protein
MATIEAQATVRARSRFSLDAVVQWSIVIVTILLVLFPAWPLFVQAFMDKPLYDATKQFSLSNVIRTFTSQELWSVVGTTAIYGVLSTLLAVALGTVLALLITRTDMPGKALVSSLVLIPFFVSPLVLAYSWDTIFGRQGYFTILIRTLGLPTWDLLTLGGMIVVTAMFYAPNAYLQCTASLALSDPQLEDAARIAGANPFLALWRVTVPLLRPAITFSALFIFVSSIEMLAIPLVLGMPVNIQILPSYLYKIGAIGSPPDYGQLAVVSILLILFIAFLVALQNKLVSQEKRFVTVGGKATRPRLLRLGPWRIPAFLIVVIYMLMGIVLPLIGLVMKSFVPFLNPFINPLTMLTLENYEDLLSIQSYSSSIVNSVIISVIGAAIGIVFMALVAVVVYRSTFRGRQTLAYAALFPRAFPGIIIGIGFLWAFLLIPGIGAWRNTIWAIMAAFIMRYLPLGFITISPSIMRISTELDRAARVAGASWLKMVTSILGPILFPALMSGYVLLFITFLKEYASALFLYGPGAEVIGTTLITLGRNGDTGPMAALATIQTAITFVVILLTRRFLGVKLYE